MKKDVRRLQEIVGAYNDGLYGPRTTRAVAAFCARHGIALPSGAAEDDEARAMLLADVVARVPCEAIAWGAKVDEAFRQRVREIAYGLGIAPDMIMHCIAFETGRTFSPRVRNAAGSGAVGLIQFMPTTAKVLGTTSAELARMSAEEQLSYVYRYLWPMASRVRTLDDLYMCILWPAAVGKGGQYVLFHRGSDIRGGGVTYRQNAGLDKDRDGKVTKHEAAASVRRLVPEGDRLRA